MNSHNLVLTLIISSIFIISSNSASPHFFPNASIIPPSLIPNSTYGAWDAYRKFSGCHAGEKIDGLAKLKNYFYHFGYINYNNSTNFTDDFDISLESAIKTYQLNFNLNATGWLDGPTVSQIVRPRCGVADITNGSSSMNYGKKTQSKDSSIHSVAHYSFFPGEPRWPSDQTDLTYAFLPDNQLSDTVKAVFGRAFERWAAVIPMNFSETSSYFDADIRIGFFSGDHGDGEPFDGVLGTLAHAFSPPSGRFHLDGDENWVVNEEIESSGSSSAVDMESVAVHEIGHLLGLGHSSVEGAIMFPTISAGTRSVELQSDDIEGVQNLYGPNPNYNGSIGPTTTAQERDTNGCMSFFVGSLWDLRVLFLGVVVGSFLL